MVVKKKETTYMHDIIALAKKADTLQTSVVENMVYIGINSHALVRLPDNDAVNEILQAIGIPYMKEKPGEYEKRKGAFVRVSERDYSRSAQIFYSNGRVDVSHTNMIYNDNGNLLSIYVHRNKIHNMKKDFADIMQKINSECMIGNSTEDNCFMFAVDEMDFHIAFGAMPTRLYLEDKEKMEHDIQSLFESIDTTKTEGEKIA